MTFVSSLSPRRRLSLAALFAGLCGLATMPFPAPDAADSTCGRVYLVNTQNELLLLRRAADYYEDLGQRAVHPPRAHIRSRMAISGLAANEVLVGIDFRPATGVLYGVGRIANSGNGQLYTIDVDSGLASPVGTMPRLIPLNGMAFGVDFNPVPDLLRIVSDAGQNMRVRPADSTVAGTDTMLAYPAMGDPNSGRMSRVVAVAYTNPDRDPQTNTVLHDLDVNRAGDPSADGDVLAIQVPPNAGVLNTVGRLGVDAGDLASFDIGPNNEALAAIQPVGSPFSRLYFIDLPSGNAVDLGQIGTGELIAGLGIEVGPQCDPTHSRNCGKMP
jgi:hypothetical protein